MPTGVERSNIVHDCTNNNKFCTTFYLTPNYKHAIIGRIIRRLPQLTVNLTKLQSGNTALLSLFGLKCTAVVAGGLLV